MITLWVDLEFIWQHSDVDHSIGCKWRKWVSFRWSINLVCNIDCCWSFATKPTIETVAIKNHVTGDFADAFNFIVVDHHVKIGDDWCTYCWSVLEIPGQLWWTEFHLPALYTLTAQSVDVLFWAISLVNPSTSFGSGGQGVGGQVMISCCRLSRWDSRRLPNLRHHVLI